MDALEKSKGCLAAACAQPPKQLGVYKPNMPEI
jgi:hypothetical protein